MKDILVVGGGGIGERHIRCFISTNRTRVSLCEANRERLGRLRTAYPIENVFLDFYHVDLSEFDGIVIATPPNLHVPMAIQCAKAGVPFLVAKPLGASLEGVEAMMDLVRSRALVSGVAYVRRSLPSFRKLKELADSGTIGRLRMGRFNLSQDYRRYRPDYQTIYYARKETGGGCILDAASHSINLAQWFFGKVRDVIGLHDRLEFQGVEVEDSSIIVLRFQDGGALVELFTNQFQKPNITEIELIGSEGNLRYTVDGEYHRITLCKSDKNEWEELGTYRFSRDDPYIFQAHEFLDALDGRSTLPTSIQEAEDTLRIALAAKTFGEDRRNMSAKE